MEKLRFDTNEVNKVSDLILGYFEEAKRYGNSYPIVGAYGKYNFIKKIFEQLILAGFHVGSFIELEDEEYGDYDEEFALHFTEDGITIYKIYNKQNGHYYNESPDVALIHEDCIFELLSHINSPVIHELDFDENLESEKCKNTEDKQDECAITVKLTLDTTDFENKIRELLTGLEG